MRFGKIGVILGGPSSERDISIRSGKAISNALRNRGHTVIEIGENSPIEEGILTSGIDIAFIALHGRYGEDGTVQQFLEDTGIAYTGSGPVASKKALDKHIAKTIFSEKNIPTPEYILIDVNPVRSKPHSPPKAGTPEIGERTSNEVKPNSIERDLNLTISEIKDKLSFPVVLKPVDEGSSIGLSIVKQEDELKGAIIEASKYNRKIIVEKYISGSEITVGILGNAPLAVVQIVPKKGFYSYEAKYTSGMTDYIVPARLPPDVYRKVQYLGLAAHNALGCRDFSRVDIRLDPNGNPWVLEVNTIPGFTQTSLLPKSAKAVGIEFSELCERILELALIRNMEYGIII